MHQWHFHVMVIFTITEFLVSLKQWFNKSTFFKQLTWITNYTFSDCQQVGDDAFLWSYQTILSLFLATVVYYKFLWLSVMHIFSLNNVVYLSSHLRFSFLLHNKIQWYIETYIYLTSRISFDYPLLINTVFVSCFL